MLKDKKGADYIGESFYELLDRTKLSKDDHFKLKSLCDELGICFLSTPFSIEAVDFLEEVGVDAYKVGSGELTNIPLQTHIAKKKIPTIVSVGMSNLNEIRETLKIILDINPNIILTQCTSMYPTPYSKVNLKFINELHKEFRVPVGLSDHSEGIYTALGSVPLGAALIEKHFTYDRNWPGPDQKASIEPSELKELCKGSQAIFDALNDSKCVYSEEIPVQNMARASVVSTKAIKKGEKFSKINLWVKRPGTGIPSKHLDEFLGKVANENIPQDTLIKWEMIQ